jgi:PAS domain-containing protein
MKGNQGLEALAALCGGRPKAVDMAGGNTTSNTSAAGLSSSTGIRSSPHTVAPTHGLKPASPVSAAAAVVAAKTNQILTRQAEAASQSSASLMNASNGGNVSVPTQLQQNLGPATAPVSNDSLVALGTGSLGNLTPQQISQAIVAAANSQVGRLDPALAQSLLYPTTIRGGAGGIEAVGAATPVAAVPAPSNNLIANTMQQLVIQQYLQAQANAQVQQQQQQAQAAATAAATSGHSQAALLAMTLAAGNSAQAQQHFIANTASAPLSASTGTTTTTGAPSDPQRSSSTQQQQVQQQAQAQALLQHVAQQQQQQQLTTAGFTSIKPAIQQQYHFPNGTPTTGAGGSSSTLPSMMKIAAAGGRILPSTDLSTQNSANMRAGIVAKEGRNANGADDTALGSKKQQKRAANRRSAQLSRKRKKQFIEELKEENDDLRRKEQILRAIPDLVVVFDSSGRLGFVSESVGRFLDLSPDKLEGTSFWDLICEESVRMLKAAFMDSLAAREADSDTAALGSGVWELRLKNQNSKFMFVTLNGVVHFKGDAPECVCCIRPFGEEEQQQKQEEKQLQDQQQEEPSMSLPQPETNGRENENNTENHSGGVNKTKNTNRAVLCSDGDASRISDESNGTHQSVLNSLHGGVLMLSAEQDEAANDAKKRSKKFRRHMASAEDGDNQNSSSIDKSNNDSNVEADGTNNSVRISDGDSNDGIESD